MKGQEHNHVNDKLVSTLWDILGWLVASLLVSLPFERCYPYEIISSFTFVKAMRMEKLCSYWRFAQANNKSFFATTNFNWHSFSFTRSSIELYPSTAFPLNLSGLNFSGSSQSFGSLWMVHTLVKNIVSFGISYPQRLQSWADWCGTRRARGCNLVFWW